MIVQIATHDAISTEDVVYFELCAEHAGCGSEGSSSGGGIRTLCLNSSEKCCTDSHPFSQRFKAYLSVQIRGDVFANPLTQNARNSYHVPRNLAEHRLRESETGRNVGAILPDPRGALETRNSRVAQDARRGCSSGGGEQMIFSRELVEIQ